MYRKIKYPHGFHNVILLTVNIHEKHFKKIKQNQNTLVDLHSKMKHQTQARKDKGIQSLS